MITNIFAKLFGLAVFILLMWLLLSIIEATGTGGSSTVGVIALCFVFAFAFIGVWAFQKFKEKSSEVKLKIAQERGKAQTISLSSGYLKSYL